MTRCFFKLLIILLPVAFGQKTYGQSSFKNISPKEYYDFFNSIAGPGEVRPFNLDSEPEFNDTASILRDKTFTSADIEFMKYQIMVSRNFRWESNRISGSTVIGDKEIRRIFKHGGWDEFDRKFKNGFVTFSVPLFTVDKKICIVYKAIHCGSLCGEGGSKLYKKIGVKWVFVRAIGSEWVS